MEIPLDCRLPHMLSVGVDAYHFPTIVVIAVVAIAVMDVKEVRNMICWKGHVEKVQSTLWDYHRSQEYIFIYIYI
jgi:hypothetical protein